MSKMNGALIREAENELAFAFQRYRAANEAGAEGYTAEYARMAAVELLNCSNRYHMFIGRADLVIQPGKSVQRDARTIAEVVLEGFTPSPTKGEAAHWETDCAILEGVEPKSVSWIWEPRLPRKMVTILCGAKAAGKGQIAVAIMSAISSGGRVCGDPVPKGKCLYLNSEDPREETIVPRLIEAGADMSQIAHISCRQRMNPETGKTEKMPITLAFDFHVIVAECEKHRPAVLVIDTLFSHCGADINSNQEMAPIMARLALLAEEFNMAVLIVHHPTKMPHARASSDVNGATCIGTSARSVLMAGFDAGKERRALFHVDSNVGREAEPVGYEVAPFVWTGETDLTLDEIRRHGPRRDGRKKSEEAIEFIERVLEDGAKPSVELDVLAKENGITKGTLDKAKRGRVTSKKLGKKTWVALKGKEPPEWKTGTS